MSKISSGFQIRIKRIFWIILCLSLSLTIGVSSEVLALSIEEERILGEKFLTYVKGNFELVEDDFANQFLNDLGRYLTSPLEVKYFSFHFYIIKDENLNAFAAPGGHIFVFSGLVEALDNVDELASVICHEIGHVSARHLAQRIEKSKKIGLATMAGILAGALIGGKAAGALAAGSMAAGIQAQLHYSRNDERQADQLGFEYMKPSGFDPGGMIGALTAIEKGNLWGTERIPPYLLTHPTGPERISNLETMLSHFVHGPPTKVAQHFEDLYPFFRTLLRAKCLKPHEAERLFKLELEKTPSSPLPYFGLGLLYKEMGEYDQALRYLRESLKRKPNSVLIMRTTGEVFQENGRDKEAISLFEKALELDAEDRATSYFLALSYESLGQYQKSIRLLKKLAAIEPVKEEIYYHLGLSYGRQNRLALAHYNFGLFFKKAGQKDKARFHFRKAADFSRNDPKLKERIQEAMKDLL